MVDFCLGFNMNLGQKFWDLVLWTGQLPYRIHFPKMSELKKEVPARSLKNLEKHSFLLGLIFQAIKSFKLVSVLIAKNSWTRKRRNQLVLLLC